MHFFFKKSFYILVRGITKGKKIMAIDSTSLSKITPGIYMSMLQKDDTHTVGIAKLLKDGKIKATYDERNALVMEIVKKHNLAANVQLPDSLLPYKDAIILRHGETDESAVKKLIARHYDLTAPDQNTQPKEYKLFSNKIDAFLDENTVKIYFASDEGTGTTWKEISKEPGRHMFLDNNKLPKTFNK